MDSTEAKAKWVHLVNYCVVDEDYSRVSRPPNFIPSSSKSKSENNIDDLSADSKWWLYQEHKANIGSFCNPQWQNFPENLGIQKVEAVIGDTLQKKATLSEAWTEDDHVRDYSDEADKLFSELESKWIGMEKNEPWWRTADLDDFVSSKSLQHFDNCDLPIPLTNKTGWLVSEKGPTSLHQDPNIENSSFTDPHDTSGVIGCSPCGLGRPFSVPPSYEAKYLETPNNSELSNTQLLEALCHSQRRAKEAERAAQEACNEKEHIITLFLKQASQIFAYRQWLYILHLERLCLQLRLKKHDPIYTRFPHLMAWSPTKVKIPKWVHKASNKRYKMHKSGGNIFWGLALVGAGVVLGCLFHAL